MFSDPVKNIIADLPDQCGDSATALIIRKLGGIGPYPTVHMKFSRIEFISVELSSFELISVHFS